MAQADHQSFNHWLTKLKIQNICTGGLQRRCHRLPFCFFNSDLKEPKELWSWDELACLGWKWHSQKYPKPFFQVVMLSLDSVDSECRLPFHSPPRMRIPSNVGVIQIRCAGPQVIDCKTSLKVFDIHWNILLHTAVLCYSDRSLELEQDTMVAILGLGRASEKLGQWKMAKWKPVQSPWLSRCGKFLHNWQIKAFELRGLLKVFPKLPRLAGFEQTFNELAFLSEKAVK